jgi:hypothetical protein
MDVIDRPLTSSSPGGLGITGMGQLSSDIQTPQLVPIARRPNHPHLAPAPHQQLPMVHQTNGATGASGYTTGEPNLTVLGTILYDTVADMSSVDSSEAEMSTAPPKKRKRDVRDD